MMKKSMFKSIPKIRKKEIRMEPPIELGHSNTTPSKYLVSKTWFRIVHVYKYVNKTISNLTKKNIELKNIHLYLSHTTFHLFSCTHI